MPRRAAAMHGRGIRGTRIPRGKARILRGFCADSVSSLVRSQLCAIPRHSAPYGARICASGRGLRRGLRRRFYFLNARLSDLNAEPWLIKARPRIFRILDFTRIKVLSLRAQSIITQVSTCLAGVRLGLEQFVSVDDDHRVRAD